MKVPLVGAGTELPERLDGAQDESSRLIGGET
jgi:hypothetical protein